VLLIVELKRTLLLEDEVNEVHDGLITYHEPHLSVSALHELMPEGEVRFQPNPVLGYLVLQKHEHGLQAPHQPGIKSVLLVVIVIVLREVDLVVCNNTIERGSEELGYHLPSA
jgi:hypothetical protein